MLLNPELPKFLGPTAALNLNEVQPCFLKYVRYEEALEIVEQPIRRVLIQMSRGLKHQHRYTLVDVKVKDVKAGECTCIPGWHIDSVTDPRHGSLPENHIIWIQGARTEFLNSPVEFPPELNHFSQVLDKIPNDSVFKINPNAIYQYGRYHLHRGPVAKKDHRRVLIRITETNVVKPIPYRMPS